MYFSFDKVATSIHSDNSIEDKSGHFNDASASMRAHVSSRSYGKLSGVVLDPPDKYELLNYTRLYALVTNEPAAGNDAVLVMWISFQ